VLIISWHLLSIQHYKDEAGYELVRMIYKEGCKDEAYEVKEIPYRPGHPCGFQEVEASRFQDRKYSWY
jgi:hypothetical protein